MYEVRAATAAARRAGRLPDSDLREVKGHLEARWSQLLVIEADDLVTRAAGDIAERFLLRGCDAVRLASALAASEGGTLVFVSWDQTVSRAASRAGLAVAPVAGRSSY